MQLNNYQIVRMERLSLKRKIIITIIITIILLLPLFIIGGLYGFPWERYIAIKNAKIYVEEKYKLTPIKATYHIFYFPPTEYITIYTKELDFSFDVYTEVRVHQENKRFDNYLDKMSEYILAKDLVEYVKEKTDNQGNAYASLYVLTEDKYTLSETEANPQIIFEKLQNKYYCGIQLYNDISKNHYIIDYTLVYDIYNYIFELGLNPNSIYFSYRDKKGSKSEAILKVNIDNKHFPNINSSNDLKPFFEEAIQKLNEK